MRSQCAFCPYTYRNPDHIVPSIPSHAELLSSTALLVNNLGPCKNHAEHHSHTILGNLVRHRPRWWSLSTCKPRTSPIPSRLDQSPRQVSPRNMFSVPLRRPCRHQVHQLDSQPAPRWTELDHRGHGIPEDGCWRRSICKFWSQIWIHQTIVWHCRFMWEGRWSGFGMSSQEGSS